MKHTVNMWYVGSTPTFGALYKSQVAQRQSGCLLNTRQLDRHQPWERVKNFIPKFLHTLINKDMAAKKAATPAPKKGACASPKKGACASPKKGGKGC